MKNLNPFSRAAFFLRILMLITSSVILFNVAEVSAQTLFCGPWQKKANMPQARNEHVTVATDMFYAFMGLGTNGITSYDDWWQYDPVNDTFIQKTSFPGGPRKGAVAFYVNSLIYVGTGDSAGTLKNDWWEYDPSDDTWAQKADFSGAARSGAVALEINGIGYIGTGNTGLAGTNDFWEYEPFNDVWFSKAVVPTPPGPAAGRNKAFAFAIGNKGYVGGGIANPGGPPMFNELNEFDPTGNSWTPKDSMTGARNSSVAFVLNGKGYVGFGANPAGTYNGDLQEYDPVSNNWFMREPFPAPARATASGFVFDGKGYMMGGMNQANYLNEVWAFDTTVTPNTILGTIRLNGNPVDTVDMVLIRKRLNTTRWDTIQRRPSNANGEYMFTNIDSGTYMVYAKPNPVLTPHTSPTYFGNVHLWDNATRKHCTCSNIDTLDIDLISFGPRSGNGRLNGLLYHGTAKQRAEPIEDEDIIIEEVPPGTPVAYSRTDNNGFFQVDSLEPGNYRVVVEIAGMTMTSDLFVAVSGTDTVFENTDFIVDTAAGLIKPVADTVVAVAENNMGSVLIYPNPAKQHLIISFEWLKWKAAAVELYNMEGQLVMRKEEMTDARMLIDRNQLPSGIYFVKIICREGVLKERILFD
jgi:N-acetylneuraminic acid mutarotase